RAGRPERSGGCGRDQRRSGPRGHGRRRRRHARLRAQGRLRPRLRHGRCAGAARRTATGRVPRSARRRGQLCDPPRRRADAGPHERAPRRGERALPAAQRDGRREQRVPTDRRRARDRRQRRHESRRAEQPGQSYLRNADPQRGRSAERCRSQAVDEPRLRGDREPTVRESQDRDALRGREGFDRAADRRRQSAVIPFFSARSVEAAVPPTRAVEAVRDAFIAYGQSEWTMPPKVYVPAYPAGDFRAMPALGAGHALLKWVTSFPGNPARGLPTVTGLVLLSDASDGSLVAVLDAGAVTALRTGAAAVLAAETLGRRDAETTAVIGAGVNGSSVAKTFLARGRRVMLWDVDEHRARATADELGADVASSREQALAAHVVATVTPGHEIVFVEGSLQPGQHVSLMGADGPGKAEIAIDELVHTRVFCDDWAQASHNGDLVHAVEAGRITREDVAQLGDVLSGSAPG